VGNSNIKKMGDKEYRLLLDKLKKNYLKTLKGISDYDFSEFEFEEMDEYISGQIYELLSEREFHVIPSIFEVLECNPLFLLVSLEDSYTRTLNLIVKRNYGFFGSVRIPSLKRENEMIEEVLLDKKFVLTSVNVSLIKNSPVFLIASLKNDYKGTLNALNFIETNILDIRQEDAKEIMKAVFDNRMPEYREMPEILKNIIIRYVNEYYNEDEDYINNLIDEQKLPVSYVGGGYMCVSRGFWNNYTSDEISYIYSCLDEYDSQNYWEKDEVLVVEALKRQYPLYYGECTSVEDVLVAMHKNRLIREELSVMEMIAFQLYAVKKLNELGIERKVDVFSYNHNFNALGTHDPKTIEMRIIGSLSTVEEMVRVLNHEIEHARQYENAKTCNIAQDFDIDIYCKDSLLREILGREYYDEHHHHFSDEFDAQFKAMLSSNIFFDDDKGGFDLDTLKREARKSVVHVESELICEERYIREYERPGGWNLNSFFEKTMQELKENNNAAFERIIKNNPIITYEYKNGKSFERKTIAELVECFDKSSNKKDKGIYYNLIISRFCEYKEGEEKVENNISEFIRLCENNKYKGATKKILDFIYMKVGVFSSSEYENRKYIRHFYAKNKTKR